MFDFDGKVLVEALRRTFQDREHNFTAEQFEQVMSFDEYKEDKVIAYCDIEIYLAKDDSDVLEWLVSLLNEIGIPQGSVLQGIKPEIEVGTLEGLACYLNGVDYKFGWRGYNIYEYQVRNDLVRRKEACHGAYSNQTDKYVK